MLYSKKLRFPLLRVCAGRVCLVLALLVVLCGWTAAQAQNPIVVQTAWLGEHEAFPMWYAKQIGLDKEAGFDIRMERFQSGKNIFDVSEAFAWQFAACGAVPLLAADVADSVYILAVTNEESQANALFLRETNARAQSERIKGLTVLCPPQSSAHFTLFTWLKAQGLRLQDVTIRPMEPSPAAHAFMAGQGDAVVLWSPHSHLARAKGFQESPLSDVARLQQPTVLVVNKAFADANPNDVTAFLGIYYKALEALQNIDDNGTLRLYKEFISNWCGVSLSDEDVAVDLKTHQLFSKEEQRTILEAGGALSGWLDAIALYLQDISPNKARTVTIPEIKNIE